MNSSVQDFNPGAYFRAKHRDVTDVRASKLIPYLSLHDQCYIETTNTALWPNSCVLLRSDWSRELVATGSPESSTISTQATSETPSTGEHSTDSPHPEKRQKFTTNNHMTEIFKLERSPETANSRPQAGQNEHPALPRWNKSVIVRLRPRPNQVNQDLRYTLVKLPAPDVESFAAAICAKMDISFTKGMSISWVDSKTSLQGPIDQAFLQNMSDMQDFVITVQTTGEDGNVRLLLEV